MNDKKRTAHIFLDSKGFYFCDSKKDYLDARGTAYRTKTCAIRAASNYGYTHYQYGDVIRKISKKDHELNWAYA